MHGGREAQLIFFFLARGSFSLQPLIRLKALYLASLMSPVLKPYSKQTKEVTAGTSTSSDVSDRNMFIHDICSSRGEDFTLPFLKKQDMKSHTVRE